MGGCMPPQKGKCRKNMINTETAKQKYTYYRPLEDEHHYPFATEMARILYDTFGFATKTGKLTTRLTKALLENLRRAKGEPKLFYPTQRGMAQVFMSYDEVIDFVQGLHTVCEKETPYEQELDGAKYNFMFI